MFKTRAFNAESAASGFFVSIATVALKTVGYLYIECPLQIKEKIMSDCRGNASKKTITIACSGAADVGALADWAARALANNGKGLLFCLAAMGVRVEGKLKEFMSVDEVISIDGCNQTMALNAGRTPVAFDRGVLGYVKGEPPGSDEVVYEAGTRISRKLACPAGGEMSASGCCS
ncbi:MAG: hypothetical protein FD164_2008 [Nitrospirae bacterium]|nr:MAG: hypothetical protein FD164_2008 [Nitrospirota bacterium]